MAERVTLADVKAMDDVFITPAVAGQVIGADPQGIRVQAQTDATKLGFPVVVVGTRVKIPRLPFVRFIEAGN